MVRALSSKEGSQYFASTSSVSAPSVPLRQGMRTVMTCARTPSSSIPAKMPSSER